MMKWLFQGLVMTMVYKFFMGVIFCIFVSTTWAEEPALVDLQKISENLKNKEKILNERESNLNEKEKYLNEYESELKKKEAELSILRQKLEDLYNKIRIAEDKNLDQLAKVYASTKAKSAAEIIVKMELSKAVSLFQRMNPMSAGKILTAMGGIDPDFASKISEILTPTRDKLK